MNRELEEYYNDYFELFRTKGWVTLKEEFLNESKSIGSIETTKDLEDLFFRKGQLNIISFVLNLEEYIERGFEEAKGLTKDDF